MNVNFDDTKVHARAQAHKRTHARTHAHARTKKSGKYQKPVIPMMIDLFIETH